MSELVLQLNSDQIVEQAVQEAGLSEFDGNSYREGLDILVSDLNAGDFVEPLLENCHADYVRYLRTRLQVIDYFTQRPELAARPIARPIFVFGIPRTGTTLLNNLLAADPAHRSPLTWEIDEPIPPATTETLYTDPRALARLETERAMLEAYPEAGKYYRSSAIYPNEDVWIMAQEFKTLMLESPGKLPGYKEFIFSTDVTSAYEYHKLFLQVMQSEAPGTWNLKMPSHSLNLQTLLKVYPDARLVWTHRDPLTATGSFCSLLRMGHSRFQPPDLAWIADDMPWQAQQHCDRAMDARAEVGHDRILDVHYAELMRDPISTMRALYAGLGDDFTAEAEAGMQAWLDDNPQGKFGRHEYRLDEFGLTVDEVRKRFDRYLSEYDVEPEG